MHFKECILKHARLTWIVEASAVDDEERCTSLQFKCVSSGLCIPGAWLCDRTCDCLDCSDECGQCVYVQSVISDISVYSNSHIKSFNFSLL